MATYQISTEYFKSSAVVQELISSVVLLYLISWVEETVYILEVSGFGNLTSCKILANTGRRITIIYKINAQMSLLINGFNAI